MGSVSKSSHRHVSALRWASGTAQADVVVLAGSVGLEDDWTCGRPRFLLPLPHRTLLDDLLSKLASAVSGSINVCTNTHREVLDEHLGAAEYGHRVHLHDDVVPRGTAGCLKACENDLTGGPIIVVGASVWLEDDPAWMLEQHVQAGNALTLFCVPHHARAGECTSSRLRPAGIFCCNPEVLKFIRSSGYEDIKEQLIPALLAAGQRVGAVALQRQSHQVGDWATYVHALNRSLTCGAWQEHGYRAIAPGVWVGEEVSIADDARIVGPAIIGHGTTLAGGAVVVGPVVLAEHCAVELDAWVVRSVAPRGTRVHPGTSISDRIVPEKSEQITACGMCRRLHNAAVPSVSLGAEPVANGATNPGWALVGLAAAFVWAFWPNWKALWEVWSTDPNYGAGGLVPLAAVYLAWLRRDSLQGLCPRFSPVGATFFCLGVIMNLFGAHYLFASISHLGMVLCANGLVLMLFGWELYRRIWHALALLFLMLPLPTRLYDLIMLPLQTLSAQTSATMLEMIGIPVERFGNVLEVAGHRVAVAEACNGLRMALAFLIVTAVVACVVRRPSWQRVTLVLSAVPIALGCNVVRIVGTALLYRAGYEWLAQGMFHDGAGLLMMPLALAMILLELKLLANLSLPPAAADELSGVDGVAVPSAR